jgi:hypothetical protein
MDKQTHTVIKSFGQGKGWGDGVGVSSFNRGRKRNPENTYTGFRPRVENEGMYFVIRRWCDDERINKSFSALLNAIIPALKVACENTTERAADGTISIELNAGRIDIT